MQEDSHGSFLNGFTIGLFAGAMGYFLFATDKGQKVRKQLNTEWEKAKKELEDSGKIEKGKGTLRDFFGEIAENFQSKVLEKPKKSRQKAESRSKKKVVSQKKKFKGT